MINKKIISFCLLLHMVCNLVYFRNLNDAKLHSFCWAAFFHSSWAICFGAMMLAICCKPSLTKWDRIFVCWEGIFSMVLGLVFTLNGYGIIQHTYGFCITIISLILALVLMFTSL